MLISPFRIANVTPLTQVIFKDIRKPGDNFLYFSGRGNLSIFPDHTVNFGRDNRRLMEFQPSVSKG